jgi:hypothetical protein
MEQYWYLLIGGAVLFAGAIFIAVLFQSKEKNLFGVRRRNGNRLAKIKEYAAKANWKSNWPKADDIYLFICALPKRVRQSSVAVHQLTGKHFSMEHTEVIQMMRVYRNEILQKMKEDAQSVNILRMRD